MGDDVGTSKADGDGVVHGDAEGEDVVAREIDVNGAGGMRRWRYERGDVTGRYVAPSTSRIPSDARMLCPPPNPSTTAEASVGDWHRCK